MPAASWLTERRGRPWSFVKFSRAAYGAKSKLQSRCPPPLHTSPPACSPPAIPVLQTFHGSSSSSPFARQTVSSQAPVSRCPSSPPPPLLPGLKERSRRCREAQKSFHFPPCFLLAAERLRCCLRLVSWRMSWVRQNAWLRHLLLLKGCDLTTGIVQ